jgi:hypothetical protein
VETARGYLAWDPLVERVGAALSNSPPEEPSREAHAVIGDRMIARENDAAAREEALSAQLFSVSTELSHARAELADRDAATAELSSRDRTHTQHACLANRG